MGLTGQQFRAIWERLESLDEEITVVNEAGFPTSDLTEKIDELYEYVKSITPPSALKASLEAYARKIERENA